MRHVKTDPVSEVSQSRRWLFGARLSTRHRCPQTVDGKFPLIGRFATSSQKRSVKTNDSVHVLAALYGPLARSLDFPLDVLPRLVVLGIFEECLDR